MSKKRKQSQFDRSCCFYNALSFRLQCGNAMTNADSDGQRFNFTSEQYRQFDNDILFR